MDCTKCGDKIEDDAIIYQLTRGTWAEPDIDEEGEFIEEEVKGLYHQKCLPADLPLEPTSGS